MPQQTADDWPVTREPWVLVLGALALEPEPPEVVRLAVAH